MKPISHERAERIAKSHACENCGEYSYRRVSVKPATKDKQEALGIAWMAVKECGVCGAILELGLDDEGEIVYAT